MSLDYFQTSCGVRSHTQTVTDKPKNTSTADKSHPNDLLAENSGQTQWMTIYLSASLTVTVVLLSLIVMSAYLLKQRKFHTQCLQRRDAVSIVKAVGYMLQTNVRESASTLKLFPKATDLTFHVFV